MTISERSTNWKCKRRRSAQLDEEGLRSDGAGVVGGELAGDVSRPDEGHQILMAEFVLLPNVLE